MIEHPRMWLDDGPFTAVSIRPSVKACGCGPGGFEIYARMPPRNNVEEAKQDLICFNNRCQCNNPKNPPRPGGCMREYPRLPYNGHGHQDYIDNARGFRALPFKV